MTSATWPSARMAISINRFNNGANAPLTTIDAIDGNGVNDMNDVSWGKFRGGDPLVICRSHFFWPWLAGEIARLRAKKIGDLGVAQLEKGAFWERSQGQFMNTNAHPCDGRCATGIDALSQRPALRTSKHAVDG